MGIREGRRGLRTLPRHTGGMNSSGFMKGTVGGPEKGLLLVPLRSVGVHEQSLFMRRKPFSTL
jgi:hypothetical protein